MRLNLLSVGKTHDKEIKVLVDYYLERLPRHWNTQIVELPDIKNVKNLTPEQIKQEEGKVILSQVDPGDLVVLLDEKGKEFTSRAFSKQIEMWMGNSYRKIHLVIGGAWGFSPEVYQRANEKIALSKMTFTHQMVRLFLIEQLYRADQIQKGKPYHND